jgi:NADH:flavin oxidoreductase / NADH oxidase family
LTDLPTTPIIGQLPDLLAGSLTLIVSSRRASKSAKSSSPLDALSRSAVMSVQPLFAPVRMGDLDLPNRIVMAPLTRMRAGSPDRRGACGLGRVRTPLHRQSRPGRAARDRRSACRSRLDNGLRVGTTRLFRLSGYPSGGGRVNPTRGLNAHPSDR